MNILLVSADNSKEIKRGGKHIHQELIEKGWQKLGHNVDTVYPETKKNLFFKLFWLLVSKKNKGLAFRLHVHNLINRLSKKTESLINTRTYDIISAQDVLAVNAVKKPLIKCLKSIPAVVTLHGYYAQESVNYGIYNEREKKIIFDSGVRQERDAYRQSEAIVTVDTRIKEYIENTFYVNKPTRVIYNAIDNENFFPLTNEVVRKVKKSLDVDSNKTVLLIARRLVRKNGVIYALKAAKILKESALRGQFLFLIAGDGAEMDTLQRYCWDNDLSDDIVFLGVVPHEKIDNYYKIADIVLLPSTRSNNIEEATSLAMLEGMICKKVVIASAIGGLKEIIKDHENGLLVEDKNSQQIAEAIKKVYYNKNLYQSLSTNAYNYALNNHGYISHAQKFIEFYSQLIKL